MKASNLFLRKDKFKRQAYHADHKGQFYQIDLMDFASVNGGYVMNCIDVFTRYAESVKLKNKGGLPALPADNRAMSRDRVSAFKRNRNGL